LAESKRHHVQPQRYLRGFSIPNRDGYVWLHMLGSTRASEQQVLNVGLENRYNALRRPDGTFDNTLEGLLAELEASCYSAVSKVATGQQLDDGDRHTLALFMSNMLNRSQKARAMMERLAVDMTEWAHGLLESTDWWRQDTLNYLAATQGTTEESFERDLTRMIAGVDIDTPEVRNVGLALHSGTTDRAYLFEAMRWTFYYTDADYSFLTSDNPVTYEAPSRDDDGASPVGLNHKDVEVTFPLTREVALVADWSDTEDRYVHAKRDRVKAINDGTIRGAKRFIYSPYTSKPLQRSIGGLAVDDGPGFTMQPMPSGPGGLAMIRMAPSRRGRKGRVVRPT
jgi:hypothetical protein